MHNLSLFVPNDLCKFLDISHIPLGLNNAVLNITVPPLAQRLFPRPPELFPVIGMDSLFKDLGRDPAMLCILAKNLVRFLRPDKPIAVHIPIPVAHMGHLLGLTQPSLVLLQQQHSLFLGGDILTSRNQTGSPPISTIMLLYRQ